MPHVCGDEPLTPIAYEEKIRMPHVCGDEPDKETGTETETDVCPTYVGMNRTFTVQPCGVKCMPHVCGDEPFDDTTYQPERRMPHVCGDEPTVTGLP